MDGDKMGKAKANYTVRLNLRSKRHFENFKTLETVMVLKGRDFSDWVASVLQSASQQYKCEIGNRIMIDSEKLGREISKRFGMTVSRNQLKVLRQTVWTEGKEFYSAPNGKSRAFRYDLEKCLPFFEAKVVEK